MIRKIFALCLVLAAVSAVFVSGCKEEKPAAPDEQTEPEPAPEAPAE